jgi:hypothetical protein
VHISDGQAAWLDCIAVEDERLAATMRDFVMGLKPVPSGVELHRAKAIAGPIPPSTDYREVE